ncbi:MAG: hypothetical protein ACK5PT_19485, partial [Cereibacter sp.]
FFTTSGTLIVTRELILPFIVPGLSAWGERLAARIALAVAYATLATLAAFAPLFSAVFGSMAIPCAVQLLPALLGLCFVRWISRAAVIAGLVFGLVLVTFTEPPGLILFEGLFLDLPWGRWPLTIHSAAWGLWPSTWAWCCLPRSLPRVAWNAPIATGCMTNSLRVGRCRSRVATGARRFGR